MITVIIPNYNHGAYISEALQSTLALTSVNEVIIIDDASTDDSIAKIMAFEDSRIRLIRNYEKNPKGPAWARNQGIKSATQPFISFLDSDDAFLSSKFDSAIEILLSDSSADGVYGHLKSYDSSLKNRLSNHDITAPNDCSPKDLFNQIVLTPNKRITHVGILLRRESTEEILMDESLLNCQDTDYLLQLALTKKLVHDGEPALVARRIHKSNISLNSKRAHIYRAKLHFKWFKKSKTLNLPKPIRDKFLLNYINAKGKTYSEPFGSIAKLLLYLRYPQSIIAKIKVLSTPRPSP